MPWPSGASQTRVVPDVVSNNSRMHILLECAGDILRDQASRGTQNKSKQFNKKESIPTIFSVHNGKVSQFCKTRN